MNDIEERLEINDVWMIGKNYDVLGVLDYDTKIIKVFLNRKMIGECSIVGLRIGKVFCHEKDMCKMQISITLLELEIRERFN